MVWVLKGGLPKTYPLKSFTGIVLANINQILRTRTSKKYLILAYINILVTFYF